MRLSVSAIVFVSWISLSSCGNNNSPSTILQSSGSEVAASTVSGAIQQGGASTAAFVLPTLRKERIFARLLDFLPEANAATWMCSGAGFLTTYAGPGSYAYRPLSCSVIYRNGNEISATWSGDWNYQYGNSCGTYASGARFNPDTQSANCVIDRSSPVGGLTRVISDAYGDQYAVTHDTTGTNTGFASTIYPTTNQGVVLTCGGTGCASGRTLVISGSHLTGKVVLGGAAAETFWDHTVSTASGGLSITGTGTARSVSGTVIVQHNLINAISSSVFSNVVYGNANCCFPTGGSIATTYSGSKAGTTESLSFTSQCGEATLTVNGKQSELTLIHCI